MEIFNLPFKQALCPSYLDRCLSKYLALKVSTFIKTLKNIDTSKISTPTSVN